MDALRLAAEGSDDEVFKRLSAIADVLEGLSCKDAAANAGCSARSLNRWIGVFNVGGIEMLQVVRRGRPKVNHIRTDIAADKIRLEAEEMDWPIRIRCLAIADMLDGMDQEEAASKAGRASRQTIRRWTRAFNKAGIEGLKLPHLQ